MLHSIRKFLQTEYSKTLPVNRKAKKASVSSLAGKLLMAFFVTIFLFTIISRATESFTVARVVTENPSRDIIIHTLTGTGKISMAGEESINVISGYRIDKVFVSPGEFVSTDTILYQYSVEDLQKKYDSIEIEMEKIKIQVEQAQLNSESPEQLTTQTSLLSLKQAKDNLNVEKINLSNAEMDYKDNVQKTKDELLEDKKKEYTEALKNYDSLLFSQEKKLTLSLRILEDARAALGQENETTDNLKKLIEAYKTAVLSENSLSVYYAREAIFEAFYGSEKASAEHKEAILTSALELTGGGEYLLRLQYYITYYDDLLRATYDELENARNSEDSLVNSEENLRILNEKYRNAQQNFFDKLDEYEIQITYLELDFTRSNYELRKLRQDDKELEKLLNVFHKSINGSGYEASWKKLYDFLLKEKEMTTQDIIAAKTLAVIRAEEDYESLKKENEKEKTDLQSVLTDIEKVINTMGDGTYDYDKFMEGKWQTVNTSEEAVRVAEQVVETNKLQYELAEQSVSDRKESNIKSNKNTELTIKGYQFDLLEKENELGAVKKLLECSGEVTSPYEGIISLIGLEEGKTTMGEELIKIGVGDYVFKAEFAREQAVNVETGSTVKITLAGGKEEGIEAEINKITINENGISELTATLPADDYWIGEMAKFKVTTQSERFDLCVPIQALHEDGNHNYYVLVTREQEDILGTELIAYRIDVVIIDKNNSTAAVEGTLSRNENVIIDNSKFINNGDRVRIN